MPLRVLPRPLYVAYPQEATRPLCGLCGPRTQKHAVFYNAWTKRALCARCTVLRIEQLQRESAARKRKRALRAQKETPP